MHKQIVLPMMGVNPQKIAFTITNTSDAAVYLNGSTQINPGETADIAAFIPVVITREKHVLKLILGDPPDPNDPWPAMSIFKGMTYERDGEERGHDREVAS